MTGRPIRNDDEFGMVILVLLWIAALLAGVASVVSGEPLPLPVNPYDPANATPYRESP